CLWYTSAVGQERRGQGNNNAPMVTLQLTNYRVSWTVTTGANVFYSSDIHRLLSSPQDLSEHVLLCTAIFYFLTPHGSPSGSSEIPEKYFPICVSPQWYGARRSQSSGCLPLLSPTAYLSYRSEQQQRYRPAESAPGPLWLPEEALDP